MDYVKLSRTITNDGIQWPEHRYVWTQHNGEIPKGMQIHHINGKKKDNRIENLKLVTPKENMNQSDRWGKGYAYYPINRHGNKASLPYVAKRGSIKLGGYGTPCGAYMKSRMYYVNNT